MPDPSSLLDHALAYAAWGWPVFPVHTPTDGGCSCGSPACDRPGKHPRIGNGRNGATLDPEVIRRWWTTWPDANIGIATGVESGLLVLDVDDVDAEIPTLPDTIETITGSGGRHVIYARPEGDKYRTRVRFAPGLDTRADGGYIIAPPSLHASGRRYEWEGSSDPFEGVAPSPAPAWLVEATYSDPAPDSLSTPPSWSPDGELPESTAAMLSHIPADDYETWRDVGMALHYTDPVEGFSVWDWWSGTSAKYDASAVRREWANFSRRGHAVSNPITLDSVRRMADQHGWVDPDIEHGRAVAAAIMQSRQGEIAQQLKRGARPEQIEAPDLMPSSGLIRDIAQHILATSIRPQPILAVMAASAFVGALAGRKYRTETDLRTNLYIVALAESGAGKDHARKVVSKLALHAGVNDYLGGDRIASGPGVVSALMRHPSQLFMLDEIGFMLASMTGATADSHKRDLMATLMTLYSSASSVYRGTEYADQSSRPRQTIASPNVCIYGTSTPSAFWAALTGSQGIDGTLSRLIVASTDAHRPARQRPASGDFAPALVKSVQALAQYQPGGGNLGGAGGGQIDTTPQVAPMAVGVTDAWEALDDGMDAYMTDDASRSVYSRVPENTAKLALAHAVSQDYRAPRITHESLAWGREIALWTANSMMREAAHNIADNEVQAQRLRVLRIIRESGGITRRDLLRRCTTLRKREIEEILALLLESGEVSVQQMRGKAGPAKQLYTATG